jgi:cytoskeletal protein RodZ
MPRTASFGDILKQTRTSKGMTLEAISEHTRINIAHLVALEEENFSKLPALIFARGYLKEYMRCLSLTDYDQAEVSLKFAEAAADHYRAARAQQKPQKPSWTDALLRGR